MASVPALATGERVVRVLSALLLVFVACAVLSACIQHLTYADTGAAPGGTGQIIIKFRDAGVDPSGPHFLSELSRDAGATLVYVRPMSGGAHVLRQGNPSDGAELDRIIERLGKRRDVEYVEPDRRMRHMTGTMQ